MTQAFVHEAAHTGCDIFRVFDALNNIDQIRIGHRGGARNRPRRRRGRAVLRGQPHLAGQLYTLDYYLRFAEQLVEANTSWRSRTWPACCGHLRQRSSSGRCGSGSSCRCTCTRDTAGGQLATLIAAIDAGVDAVDVACAAWAGTDPRCRCRHWSPPTDDTERATGLSLQAVTDLEPYFEAVRLLYAPFESGLPGRPDASTPTRFPAGSCPT